MAKGKGGGAPYGNKNAANANKKGLYAEMPKVTGSKRIASGIVGTGAVSLGTLAGVPLGPLGMAAGATLGALASIDNFDYALRGKSSVVYKRNLKATKDFNLRPQSERVALQKLLTKSQKTNIKGI